MFYGPFFGFVQRADKAIGVAGRAFRSKRRPRPNSSPHPSNQSCDASHALARSANELAHQKMGLTYHSTSLVVR